MMLIDAQDGWMDPVATFVAANGDEPMDWQLPYLCENRNAVVLKGRQVGCSTAGASIAIRYARAFPNFLAAIVSPSMKQSEEVKLRAKIGLERIGERLIKDSATTLELENGSRIVSLPGTPKSVRGWSAGLLILDEAAFIIDETFLAARATVAATGGRTIVQSTPAAPTGHFHTLYRDAVDYEGSYIEGTTPDPTIDWVRFHISSEEVSSISDQFLASEKAKLNPVEYATEYLGQFASAGLGLVDPDKLAGAVLDDDEDGPWASLR